MNNAVRRCVTLAIGLLVLTGCQSDTKSSPGAVASAPHVVRPVHRADEVLVKLRPGLAAAKAGIVTLGKRAVSVRRLAPEGGHLRGHLDRWMRVALPPGMDVKTALAQLLLDPDVERVEPNYLVHTTAVPSDPSFSLQWGLRNTGANGGAPGADIDAVPAWDLQTGSASVVIAVIDTGVDIVHPDLADNIWINPGEIADNGIDDDGNGYADDVHGYDFLAETGDVSDTNGHGTNVASIAAAVGNNGVGVAGVAWGARIMPLKFADQNGAGDIADAVRAIAYAVENGARIINASWGGYGESEALRDAAAAATAAGALVVAGAGNDGSDNDVTPFYPASFEDVISVAATTPLDAKAAFSNFGRNSVDLGAPGEDIFGAFPEGRYAYFSGTSMAAPHVSGAAALLLAQLPDLTVSGLKALLLDRAEQTVAMRGVTGTSARLNAANALDCDENTVVMGVRTPADAFAVLAGDPTLVRVQLTRCGQAATGYQAEATFANGDTALTLFDDGLHGDAAADDGIYANYWVPQSITQNSSVTLTASSASGADLTRTLNGHVRQRVRYQHQEVPYDWIDTSAGTTYTLGDDDSITVPIGFTFDFYGLPRDTLNISANGLLTFGAPEGTAGNGRLPDPAFPNDVIAVLWDDLDPTTGSVSVLVQGTSPSRAFTVSWMNVSRLGAAGTVSFQATLYEGSNDIVLAWQNVVFGSAEYDYGGNAVVGVEDPDGLDATVFVYRQRLLEDASARRFYVVPAEPELAYRVTVTTSPIRAGGGKLVASVVDGDGANNNYFNILEFTSDGDVILNPALTGDASGSFLPGPAYIGDAAFANLISQAVIFGNELRFLLRVSRNGLFEPFPDSFALYLLDSADQPYPTTDPLGTDALFAIEIDRPQPFPLVFESAYASATVETVGAPTARPGGPYAGKVGSPVVFDGGASSDPENDPLSFAWDFGDGNSAGGATPSHTYSERGLYTVSLTVSDGALYSAPATARVSISLSQPPIADAGVDQTVNQLVQVTLDGGGSGDSDGVVVGYAWRQIAGPAVTLQGAGSQVATFVSPRVEVQTRLTFELTVQDDAGDSNTDTVDVTVLKNNLVPTADAGPDQSVDEGAAVLIDGSGSSDPDGWIQTYAWQQIAGPSTFLTAPNPGQLSFTAPSVAVDSVMTFEFTVTDNEGASATDTVDVVVRNTNDPIANAGPDQTVDERSSVTLDGTASADPDGTIQGYAWEQIGGYVVSVADANTATPSFTAPLVPEDSLLRFRLTVNDNDGLTGSDTVDVFVRNAEVPPTADAGPDQAVDERSQVTLTGAASSDPDGTIVAYAWTQSAGPAVTLSSASSASATFTAPAVSADTSLTFLLTVTDDDGLTGTDTVDVLVRNVVVPPTADAGADQTVDQGTSVTLSGSGSADPDGSIAAYAWMQTAGPAVTLTGANAVSASFTAPIVAEDTVLTFELIVTDNDGATASDAVDVTVRRVNAQPVADAGPDQITVEGQTVQLAGSGTDTDGTIVQHQWAQWGGVPVSLTGADTPSPDFVAPEVASTAVLRFRLTVTDNEGATADDFVDITVFDREYNTDGDGLPDGWEFQYFGDITSQNGSGDPDSDGLTNLEEYNSGADPTVADGIPPAVSQVSARAGDTDVIIEFDRAPAATRYDLYWSASPGVSSATGTHIADVTSPYIHSGLSNDTAHYYVVVAANLHGQSPDSPETSATPRARTWAMTTTASSMSGQLPNIARDDQGNAVLVYYADGVGNTIPPPPPKLYAVRYSRQAGWGTPELLASPTYYLGVFDTQLQVAMNSRGDAVTIWIEDDGIRRNLWSRVLPASATQWQTAQLVETFDGSGGDRGEVFSAHVSIGDDGLMAAVWTQGVPTGTYASLRTLSQPWSPRRLMGSGGYTDEVNAAADGRGGAFVTWTSGSAVLGARYSKGAWDAPATLYDDSGYSVSIPRIGADSQGNAVVAFVAAKNGKRTTYDIRATRYRAASGWDPASQVIDAGSAFVDPLRLDVRRTGEAVVAWTQNDPYANFMAASGAWSGPLKLRKGGVLFDMASDSAGRALAVVRKTDRKTGDSLYWAPVTPSGWGSATLLAPGAVSGRLAADEYGNAIAVWPCAGICSATYEVREP